MGFYDGSELNDTAIIVMTTITDAYGCSKYPENPEMIKGTVTEQAVDIVTICPDGNVRLTRIGAGKDRAILYKK